MIKMKKAFSLIEVIFVLTILGIVASISSQIIVQVYENYITQKALYKTTTKTEIAITQIVNRLAYAVDGTTITKNPTAGPYTKASEGNNWIKLSNIDITDPLHAQFTTIEWIGYDNDSFSAATTPYWSGVANYDSTAGFIPSRTQFETPGSRLTLARDIIKNLSNNNVALDGVGGSLPAVIFTGKEYLDNSIVAPLATQILYDPACMGLVNENNRSCISRVSMRTTADNTHLTFPDAKQKKIYERYKLAWTAYALVPEDKDGDNLFDLNLYYNYQPWNGDKYTDGQHSLLINNVSVFKFTENGGVIQLKLCATENIGQDFNISSCKEKAIIR
jgi:prepilin-type N-terminal cleavage/methylation domain-containing protein